MTPDRPITTRRLQAAEFVASAAALLVEDGTLDDAGVVQNIEIGLRLGLPLGGTFPEARPSAVVAGDESRGGR